MLTPVKVGLLVLIDLYTRELVPPVLEVLSLITTHVLDGSNADDRWAQAQKTMGLITSLKELEAVLGSVPATTGLPGRSLWDLYVQKLWELDSADALISFFSYLPTILAPTRKASRDDDEEPEEGVLLSPTSLFGTYVKRAHLDFSKFNFKESIDLWRDFVRYRQPTEGVRRRRSQSITGFGYDSALLEGQHIWGDGTDTVAIVAYGEDIRNIKDGSGPAPTVDDVELLLEFQIEQMQKFGNRVPPELTNKYQALLKEASLIPSLSHYLRFLDAWKAGDYPTSFDYVHRYFDYTMQNRDRLFYQYALMSLAILQADFGCYKEAVAAMLETVSTARENKDMTCLNFALNWLFHFGLAHPHLIDELESNSMIGTGKETLAFLRVKAKETGMWTLWSSALLSEAKVGLGQGDNIAGSLEYLVRSSQVIVERNLKTMMGSQLSLNIALWDRFGVAYLSKMTCDIFQHCHAHNTMFDDELKITCRLAGLLAGKGKYNDAFQLLERVDSNSLRSWKPNQYLLKYRGLLKLRRNLHRNNLDAAEYLLGQLLQAKPDDLEPDMVVIVDSLHVEALIRRGNLDLAFRKVDTLIEELRQQDKDIALRVRFLLMKAHLFDLSGRPQRGFTIAMRAIGMAWRARIIPLLWQAVGALANILTSLEEFEASAELLLAIIPRCLECEASFMVGTLYGFLADAYMGQAREAAKRAHFLNKAKEALTAAHSYFSTVEDVEKQKEMLDKTALIALLK